MDRRTFIWEYNEVEETAALDIEEQVISSSKPRFTRQDDAPTPPDGEDKDIFWPEEEILRSHKAGITGQYKWRRETKEYLGYKDQRQRKAIDWANLMRWPNGNICFPLRFKTRDVTSEEAKQYVADFVAQGGVINICPPKQSKYVFSKVGAKHADALRKRAYRGDKEAQEELAWFRHRALPKPYVPDQELACDAHSIRSNIPWDFEDGFIDRLGLKPLLGDTLQEDYHHDDCDDGPGYKPSYSEHDLVKPDYTQSLNRLFGREVDEGRLTKDGLEHSAKIMRCPGEAQTVKATWKAFSPTWNAALAGERRDRRKRPV
jgi:hypothetical protein